MIVKRKKEGEVMSVKKIQTLVLDGNSVFKHYFHGVKNKVDKNGYDIGGVVGFLTGLRSLLVQKKYDRVFVFWDGFNSGKLRYDFYKAYKANRDKNFESTWEEYRKTLTPEQRSFYYQLKIIRHILEELSVRQFWHTFIEGDDLVAHYCLNKEDNEEITIATKDRDFCQLITDDISIYFLDYREVITKKNFNTKFEHHIDNCLLLKIICGDNSDNVKGIKGVKEPTLLEYFPEIKTRKVSFKDIFNKVEEIEEQRKIERKKPLNKLRNIVDRVVKGENNEEIQMKDLYMINNKLMNLKEPLLTEDCKRKFESVVTSPISQEILNERKIEKVYETMQNLGIKEIMENDKYVSYFLPFKELKDNEQRVYNEWKLLKD